MYYHPWTKTNPVAGFALLLAMFFSIYFFDKWVIGGKGSHHAILFHDKKASWGKRAWRSFLWMIEIFCGFYMLRTVCANGEPFRKATTNEKRFGTCFMILFPLLMMALAMDGKAFDRAVDSFMYGGPLIVWLYVGYMAVFAVGIGFAIFVAIKIPLFVSIPLAVMSWAALFWTLFAHHVF